MPLHVSSTNVLIIRRSKYTVNAPVKFIHKFYYYVLIFIELYFSNFRPINLFQCDYTRCCVIQL